MFGKLVELLETARESANDAVSAVGEATRDSVDDAARMADDVANAVGDRIGEFAASRPKLERTLHGIGACAEHLAGAFSLFRSQFHTDLEVQIPQEPGYPYRVVESSTGPFAVSVSATDGLQRIVFHDTRLFVAGSSLVALQTADGARIEVRCGPLHEIVLKVRRPDGTIASASAVVGVDEWLSASGSLDYNIRAVRLRRRDFDTFQPAKLTDTGPGKFRALRHVRLK